MTLHNLPSIEYRFDFNSKNSDGSFPMYQWIEEVRDRLYIVNQHNKKLLQFIVKDEPYSRGQVTSAQLKIIPYAVERVKVYNDRPEDPTLIHIHEELELTYHGGQKGDENPKIHLKIDAPSNRRYKTLVDCSLCLDSAIPRLVPVCSFFPGYAFDKPPIDKITKKSHIFQADSNNPIRFDFYLSGKNIDLFTYINSIYSMNMFFSLDYLIANQNSPMQGLLMVQPITGFAMKDYYLWVRCSGSTHVGRPFIQFYNNANYYEKAMNRRIAYINDNGSTNWTTMHNKEKEITDYLSTKEQEAKG